MTRPVAVTTPHWTVGDRLAAFRVLLPADPGPTVVLAVGEVLMPHLRAAFPDALDLEEALAAGAEASLLVLEGPARPPVPLAPGASVAVLGASGEHVVYPSAHEPELLWRSGWPVAAGDPVAWARRRAGLRAARHRGAPRLGVEGPAAPTLADVVLADVVERLPETYGASGRLVGVTTAGHTLLRVRTAGGDVAVRLDLLEHEGDRSDLVDRVRAEVPAASPFLPEVLATGSTRGCAWVATAWLPRTGGLRWPWPRPEWQWAVADELADVLAATRTGQTGPGWARAWCDRAAVVPAAVRDRWAGLLAVLEPGVPTGWCHGDLWPGNVLLDRDAAVVIDWDNAAPDAPAGLDRLLVPALRDVNEPGRTVAEQVMALVDQHDRTGSVGELEVAGRRWRDWDRDHRQALALAAVVLFLRNRSPHDLPTEALAAHLDAVEAALTAPAPAQGTSGATAPGPGEPTGEAGRTARGALWLATNGVVVKTSQTVVLLALAAMLAPSALGLVALGTLVANVAVQVASLGTASALVYWRGDVLRAARTAVTIGVGCAVVLAALLWVAAPWLAAVLGAADGGAAVIRGLTVVLPCTAIAGVTNELLRRELRFLRRIVPDTVSSVVGAVVAIVLVVQGSGVMALVAGQVTQAVLTMLLSWCVHPPVLPGWDAKDARGLLGYGGPYAGTHLLELVQLNIDYLIVSAVLGTIALGQYSLAFRLAFMPYLMIVVVITGAAFPYLCRVRGRELGRAVVVVMTVTSTLVLPLCLGVALVADHLVVLGDKWSPAVPAVAWLAAYAGLLSVGQLVQTAVNAAGRPVLALGLRLAHLVLLVSTLAVVVDRGITVVAAGQAVVAAVVAVLALGLARTFVSGFSLRALALGLRPALLSALALVAAVLVVRFLLGDVPPSPGTLALLGAAGLAAYAGPLWLLDRDHLREAAALLRRPS
ncbi:oligosaccharide flippase family protein [Nocardioides sp. SOB77]|uniref:Oligosaccharide flippase family protein n=1 Tax=Nocardioides oceani TaxID=3058369 RepID=A0ABT8FIT2_9ACTN|nr:oligosaccharide flippase family protein [Nocardioides oceani]MDN4174395.1 oligosaccharide flippase family protein [Nocardioides oceani]